MLSSLSCKSAQSWPVSGQSFPNHGFLVDSLDASRLEAIALRLEAIPLSMEDIALGLITQPGVPAEHSQGRTPHRTRRRKLFAKNQKVLDFLERT